MEEWKPVAGFEGVYEISDGGSVRSKNGLLAVTFSADGYGRVSFKAGGKRVGRTIHRVVLEAFVGLRPAGYHARHLNGDKSDNRLSNLRWGTVAENCQDTKDHGHNCSLNRTHCPRGHSYSGWNLGNKEGGRKCRACCLAASEVWRLRRAGKEVNKHQLADEIYNRKQGV